MSRQSAVGWPQACSIRWPTADALVEERLEMGLIRTRNQGEADGEPISRDTLLGESQVISDTDPDDMVVVGKLAMGLAITLNAKSQTEPVNRDGPVEAVRAVGGHGVGC